MKAGTIFDNVMITDDEEAAEQFAKDTWEKTRDPEKKMKDEVGPPFFYLVTIRHMTFVKWWGLQLCTHTPANCTVL